MPRFKVLVRQFVEEIGEVEIEAENSQAAHDRAVEIAKDGDVLWADGSDTIDAEAYAIYDDAGELMWEGADQNRFKDVDASEDDAT